MFMLQSPWIEQRLVYDVSDPLHPRLICKIDNTSAHLVTGDTIEWLVPLATDETNVALRSLSKGIDTLAGTFPFRTASGSWLPDRSVMAYTTPVPADNDYFFAGGVEVWLYSQGHAASLFKYRTGIGDCICRFGLPPQVLAISPDGQYLAAGWEAGKGSEPLHVYRVADRSLVMTLDPQVSSAFWDRTGHRLFLNQFGTSPTQAWTPEAGVVTLAGAAAWSFLPGVSPDGSQVVYTAYSDPTTFMQPRIYVYDVKAHMTRMLIDKLRTQAVFVKDGWVWYLEERACTSADSCAGATMPTGKVFAMRLSTGTEIPVSFADLEDPVSQAGDINRLAFGPGEFWPAT
jgi:hypothetical protein